MFDGTTGKLVTRKPVKAPEDAFKIPGALDPYSQFPGAFLPTGTSQALLANNSCGDLSYSGNVEAIAGLDKHKSGDVVPAFMDLSNGKVIDVVPPEDHTGFTAKEPVGYVAAAFNPYRLEMWYLKVAPGDGHTAILTGPVDVRSKIPGATVPPQQEPRPAQDLVFQTPFQSYGEDSDWDIEFLQDSSTGSDLDNSVQTPANYVPTVTHFNITDTWVRSPDGTTSTVPSGPTLSISGIPDEQSRFVDSSVLPKTDYSIGTIVRSASSDGADAAFIAYSAQKRTYLLFTVPTAGGEPKQLNAITATTAQSLPNSLEVIQYY